MSDRPPFVIFALPRSRTYWLSRFLSYGEWSCGHDEAMHVRGLDDVRSWLAQDCAGTAETAAAPFWRLLVDTRSDVNIVTVRRPVEDVMNSLVAAGCPITPEKMLPHLHRYNRKLDDIERHCSVLSVPYKALRHQEVCREIFEYCLPYQHDPKWWADMNARNLQINRTAMLAYTRAHAPQIRRASAICVRHIRSLHIKPTVLFEVDGMVIQEEPFETAWLDAEALMTEHCLEVGETSDGWKRKNVPLLRQLAALGVLRVIVARGNGRMFGYLSALRGPSLESEEIRGVWQLSLFVSPDARGAHLERRMQRAAITAARTRGDTEMYFRAGVRGTGPRLGALYERFGAEYMGKVYKLELGATP